MPIFSFSVLYLPGANRPDMWKPSDGKGSDRPYRWFGHGISGAAASSNMGSATIKPLVPTLALLNVRLGYWLTNPAKLPARFKKRSSGGCSTDSTSWKELFGLLTEDSETVYLTDGGHIENLGLYELLRRRCKLIIAVDAEADPDMSFGSLVKLERYARIDFGLRIDLPWAAIRDTTPEASAEVLDPAVCLPAELCTGPTARWSPVYYPHPRENTP